MKPNSFRSPNDGFTLIELLIAVALMGILAALALPSYRAYVERTNRTVAKAALTNLASRQESYAADHKAYTSNFGRLSVSGATATAFVNSSGDIVSSSTGALYRLTMFGGGTAVATCSSLTAFGADASRFFTYVLVAEPQGRTDTRCGTICLSSGGQRGATGGADACWSR